MNKKLNKEKRRKKKRGETKTHEKKETKEKQKKIEEQIFVFFESIKIKIVLKQKQRRNVSVGHGEIPSRQRDLGLSTRSTERGKLCAGETVVASRSPMVHRRASHAAAIVSSHAVQG